MRRHGMTSLSGVLALEELAKGDRTMTSLARACQITTAAMTGSVDRLELRRLVCRINALGDRRLTMVKLTEHGRAVWDDFTKGEAV